MLAEPTNHLTDQSHPEQRMGGGYRHGGSYWGIGSPGRLEIVGQIDGGTEEEGDTHQPGYCASCSTSDPVTTRRHCAGEQRCRQEQRWGIGCPQEEHVAWATSRVGAYLISEGQDDPDRQDR